uniref:Uncharacterized protein n=1 Tax=Oryza sativa subsp. japonica TaxID=39947 RepID=Q6Z8F2_ORYSJ|nr:hypothetical protein [Oryza sativa Japonica Group]
MSVAHLFFLSFVLLLFSLLSSASAAAIGGATANDTTAPAKPAGAGPQLKLLVDKHSRRRARTRWTSSSASSAFVSFVEADADVSLEEFGDSLCPPIPCTGELLTLPDSNFAVVTDRPLLYVQVTRLRCGGFVFSTQICHNLVDAAGITQFLQAVGELAEGAERPAGCHVSKTRQKYCQGTFGEWFERV